MNPAFRNLLITLILLAGLITALFVIPLGRHTLPDISFTDIDGGQHQLADFKGQPILMIFWATDCPGCIQEMPELIALHKEYTGQGLAMIGIALPHDRPEQIQAMRVQKGLPYLISWDKTGAISAAFDDVRVTPTHFLVSAEGEILMRKIGALDFSQLKQRLAMMGVEPDKS